MKILHLEHDKYPAEALQKLETAHEVEAFECNSTEQLHQKLQHGQYEAIFTKLGLMLDETAMALQPGLKYIVTSTTGLNHIDTGAAEKRGIKIISLKGEATFLASVKSTAEHTWALLLALIRNIPGAHSSVQAANWDRLPFLSDELDEKTLGIIGYGRLGKIVARYGEAFGMYVLVNDHKPVNPENGKHVLLNELLQQSDYVLLMISYSPENEKFMDAAKFTAMKSGAYFINTSRGEMVDEEALLTALESKHLKGAALDVLNDDSAWSVKAEGSFPLIEYAKTHTNLILTPHMGGYGKHSIAKTRNFVTDKFLTLANNETGTNS